jgi:hypothetical protein
MGETRKAVVAVKSVDKIASFMMMTDGNLYSLQFIVNAIM